jgi:hypothetical protein
MLRIIFNVLTSLLVQRKRDLNIELVSMVTTLVTIVFCHFFFLIFIFTFEWTFLVDEYGGIMLTLSCVIFSFFIFG